MKPTEAAALLTIAAAYDNRKPDADQAKAWAMALDGLRFEDCRTAIVDHYRARTDWLMPAHVVTGVKRLRNDRWNTYVRRHGFLLPPGHMADDPASEHRWVCEITERIRRGELTSPDQFDDRGELTHRDIASLGQIGREVPDA